jgi:hypothetical protein
MYESIEKLCESIYKTAHGRRDFDTESLVIDAALM